MAWSSSAWDRICGRHRTIDLEEERAEAAIQKNEDEAARQIAAQLAHRTPAELQAEAMRAAEDEQDLKHLPIGITRDLAKRRGWL